MKHIVKIQSLILFLAVIIIICSGCGGSSRQNAVIEAEENQLSTSDPDLSKNIRLVTFGPNSELELNVRRFNDENTSASIRLIDYTEEGTIDLDSALQTLNTQIAAGEIPDMICFSNISPFPFIRKGLIVDLSQKLQDDPGLNISDLAIEKALKSQSGVYYLSPKFALETLLGKYSRFGEKLGWTMSDYLEIENTLMPSSHMIYNITGEAFLERLSSRYLKTAIQWETGSCEFNNQVFEEIIETSTRIQENPIDLSNMEFIIGEHAVAQEELLTILCWVDNVWKLSNEERMAECRLSTVGWPTIDGSCGSDIYLTTPVGIFGTSGNIDTCWDFLKFMLKNTDISAPEGIPVTFESGMPCYKPLLEKKISLVMQSDDYPVKLSDEDVERFYHLLDSTTNIAIYDETIMGIIKSECQAVFRNEVTAHQAADLIQSKVSRYLAEIS